MSKKVLITGVTGFVGSFLAEHLASRDNYELFGTSLSNSHNSNISSIEQSIDLVVLDLTNSNDVESSISKIKPDYIYHLAALASPAESFEHPEKTITNNISAQLNILEALRKAELTNSRTLVVSSAEIYGSVDEKDLPIDESDELRPRSPYAVSKVTQDFLGLQYYLSYKMPIIRARPFNHIGPRQSPSFVVASFAKQIAEIEKNKSEKTPPVIQVGNTDTKRDFTDVRDIVKAYVLLMEKGVPGEAYNVGSGTSHAIHDLLLTLTSLAKFKMEIQKDPERFRPSDIPHLLCNNKKITALGWSPSIPIEKTLQDTLDYWRTIV